MNSGQLFFSWGFGRAIDRDVKFFRLVADVANDLALTLELVAPALSYELFVPALCVASVARAVCGVAAGCVRATLTQHFARQQNLSDVSAKEASQETAVTLMGMLVGAWVVNAVGLTPHAAWTAFAVLTLMHVICNYLYVPSTA